MSLAAPNTFIGHMVFQCDCTNTLNDQTPENVTVWMEPTEAYEMPAQSLPFNPPGTCYTLVALANGDPTAVACTFICMMKFTVKDSDHIQKVMKLNLKAAWDEAGDEFGKEEMFALSTIETLGEAVDNIVKFLGVHPCARSDKVLDDKNTTCCSWLVCSGVVVTSRCALSCCFWTQ
ncbi:Coatomer subunit gamma-1 [Saguinus oedipus]|uniref:Coatomer subunit gamma-1 n=1 Tax=Saguinus oedipus TaxID=9490 RepID=A0ABQ9TWZ9_SAGOE|nr:Coatomer subunit gamma-1 [Saguinus oedipus]